MEFFTRLFNTEDFMPRWYCGDWTTLHGYTHVTADLLIWGAYTAIPLVLAYFVRQRRDLPLPNIFWLFCAFIFACGATHLVESLMFWWPAYRFSAVAKVATATVSWATVLALIPATPKALALPGLAKVNAELHREIARRHAAETELAAANRRLEEKHQEMAELLSIVTHDLKHPVFSIRTLTAMLQQRAGGRLDDDHRRLLDMTLGECDRMTEMLGQLGELSRIDRVEPAMERVNLRGLLERCAARFRGAADAAGATLRIDAPDADAAAPRQQIEQALNNLIENAIKYGIDANSQTIDLTAELSGGEARVTVADRGPGIDPRHHQRVFQMFHRMAPEEKGGSGVGLAAVRKLMQRVGGSVTLDSAPGRGARFTLRFPVE